MYLPTRPSSWSKFSFRIGKLIGSLFVSIGKSHRPCGKCVQDETCSAADKARIWDHAQRTRFRRHESQYHSSYAFVQRWFKHNVVNGKSVERSSILLMEQVSSSARIAQAHLPTTSGDWPSARISSIPTGSISRTRRYLPSTSRLAVKPKNKLLSIPKASLATRTYDEALFPSDCSRNT